jgi:hypothetical protein
MVGKRNRGKPVLSLTLGALLISSLLLVLPGCTTELIDTINRMVDFYNRTDKDVPVVIFTTPTHGYPAALNAKITITFDEFMDPDTINQSTVIVKDISREVEGTVTYIDEFKMAVFTPASNLVSTWDYTVRLTNDIRDKIGNRLEEYFWSFQADVVDSTAPTIVARYPDDGDTEVSPNVNVTVTFSEALDPLTIKATSFMLYEGPDAGINPVSGKVAYNDASKTLIFNPAANLKTSTVYTAQVLAGVSDLCGISISAAETWSFTVGTEIDSDPPGVVDYDPDYGDIDVGIAEEIWIDFDEPMNPETINNKTFSLETESGPVDGVVVYDPTPVLPDRYRASFLVKEKMSYMTQYYVSVSGAVEDMAGNKLGSGRSWTFVTVASTASASGINVDLVKIGTGPTAEQFSALVDFTDTNSVFLPGLTKFHFDVLVRINLDDPSLDWKEVDSRDLTIATTPQPKLIVMLVDSSEYMGHYWDYYLEMMNEFVKSLGAHDQVVLITYAAEDPHLDPAEVLRIYPKEGFTSEKELILYHLTEDIVPKDPPWMMGWEAIGKGLELIEDFKNNSPGDDAAMGHHAVIAFTTADTEHFNPVIHTYNPEILLEYAESMEAYIYSLLMYPGTKLEELAAVGEKSSGFYYLFEDPKELWDAHFGALEFMQRYYLRNLYRVTWDMKLNSMDLVDVWLEAYYPKADGTTYSGNDQIDNYEIP